MMTSRQLELTKSNYLGMFNTKAATNNTILKVKIGYLAKF